MSDSLTKEIIKRILTDVGVSPDRAVANIGLTDSALKLYKSILIQYEDCTKAHDLYAGQLLINDVTMRGLLIDLTIDDITEYLFLFCVDDLPIHAIKYTSEVGGDFYIKIFNSEKQVWFLPNMEMKARMLIEFEKIVSYGILWMDCRDTDDLYNVALKLIGA